MRFHGAGKDQKSQEIEIKQTKDLWFAGTPVREQYKLLPDVNFGYAEQDGYGRLEYYPRKKGGVPRVGMVYKDRRMEACKRRLRNT